MTCEVSKPHVGTPRTVSLPPNEMILLGEEMVKWVKENDPLHISEFWCIHKRYTESCWETMARRQEFIGYYDIAMRLIGRKYLDKNSNVREGASQRWQRVYFNDLKKHEDERAAYEANLNKVSTDLAPLDSSIDDKTENMRLKHELKLLKEKYADKS